MYFYEKRATVNPRGAILRGFSIHLYLQITSVSEFPHIITGGYMTYDFFKETLVTELKGYFPPDTAISIYTIPRNNRVSVDGLTILESGCNIAPTIYIRDYYRKLRKGNTFSEIFAQILEAYYQYRPTENIDTSFFQDFSHVKKRIVFKLIHYERNKTLLETIPYVPFLDLAMVFYCLVSSNEAGTATILIHNEHLKLWDTNLKTLEQLARQNTPLLLPACLDQLSNMLNSLGSKQCRELSKLSVELGGPADLEAYSVVPMYLLTNRLKFLGASCLLYETPLKDFARRMDSDLYVIPSSIHEVLLVPTDTHMSREGFNEMIREVNATQLAPEEILSDHVYYYDRQADRLMA